MTDTEILGLFEKTEFPEFLGEDNVEDFSENKTHFPETFKFNWNTGASKLVILPFGEDFVIKIPFNGQYCGYEVDDETGEIISEGRWEYFTSDEYYSENMEFDGNYCGREADISDMATAEDLEECFAITECVGRCRGYLIYKQARATTILDDVLDEKSDSLSLEERKSIRDKCNNMGVYGFNIYWLKDFLEFFGEEILKQLDRFINTYDINDLHTSNVGYIGNRPVLIDYSGYFE